MVEKNGLKAYLDQLIDPNMCHILVQKKYCNMNQFWLKIRPRHVGIQNIVTSTRKKKKKGVVADRLKGKCGSVEELK